MIPRRRFIETTALAGALGIPAAADAAQQQGSAARIGDIELRPVVDALSRIGTELSLQRSGFPELAPLRDPLKQYLKQNGKLPDFIEVGTDVWYTVHDWHVRWQQPLNVGQDPNGRYTIALLRTIVILRQDMPDRFVGQPYDTVR